VVSLQLAHKLNASIDVVRLELEEVEAAANRIVARFAGEVDEFGQRASYLMSRLRQ
jgi:hypothetical protein